MTHLVNSIPIVDISSVVTSSPKSPAWHDVANQLDNALHSIGFVYLKNSVIQDAVVGDAFKASHDFFNLDPHVKFEYAKNFEGAATGYDYYGGYTPPGAELEGDADYEHKESFDLWGTNRIYPDAVVPSFREVYNKLEAQLKDVTELTARLLATALGVQDSMIFMKALRHIRDSTLAGVTSLRALYYPPITDESLVTYKSPTRCAAHTDYGFMTFLLMSPDAKGLEVKCVDSWISANPIPGTVLMNVGDFLELWSDGRYPATVHRVRLPELREHKCKSRMSIAYFVNADAEVDVCGLGTRFNDDVPKRKETYNAEEHIKNRSQVAYSATLNNDGKE